MRDDDVDDVLQGLPQSLMMTMMLLPQQELPQMMMTMMLVPQQELPQLQMIGRQGSCRREAEAACLAEWSPRCCDEWP